MTTSPCKVSKALAKFGCVAICASCKPDADEYEAGPVGRFMPGRGLLPPDIDAGGLFPDSNVRLPRLSPNRSWREDNAKEPRLGNLNDVSGKLGSLKLASWKLSLIALNRLFTCSWIWSNRLSSPREDALDMLLCSMKESYDADLRNCDGSVLSGGRCN